MVDGKEKQLQRGQRLRMQAGAKTLVEGVWASEQILLFAIPVREILSDDLRPSPVRDID